MKHLLRLSIFIALALQIPSLSAEEPVRPIGKVIGSEIEGNSTHLMLEVNQKLVPGRMVQLPDSLPAVVGELMEDRMGIYYYQATLPGKYKLPAGTDVYPEGTVLKAKSPIKKHVFSKKLYKYGSPFSAKKSAEITTVQKGRALIDRGAMHEVRERDIYAIYSAEGKYKGTLELRGIGDFQSQGIVYNTLEDIGRRNVNQIAAGDKAVFLGQRKIFNFHLLAGALLFPDTILTETGSGFGGGLYWGITLPDGWGMELLFGKFERDTTFENHKTPNIQVGNKTFDGVEIKHEATFWMPIWVRKYFYYPRTVSPFLGLGAAYMQANTLIKGNQISPVSNYQAKWETKKNEIVPVVGGGLELFPGRSFHPRIMIQHFFGPTITLEEDTFKTDSTYFSFALSASW